MQEGLSGTEIFQTLPTIMEKYKFDEIKYYATYLWADLNKKDQDDLWMLGLLSKEFSDSRMKCIHSFNYGS